MLKNWLTNAQVALSQAERQMLTSTDKETNGQVARQNAGTSRFLSDMEQGIVSEQYVQWFHALLRKADEFEANATPEQKMAAATRMGINEYYTPDSNDSQAHYEEQYRLMRERNPELPDIHEIRGGVSESLEEGERHAQYGYFENRYGQTLGQRMAAQRNTGTLNPHAAPVEQTVRNHFNDVYSNKPGRSVWNCGRSANPAPDALHLEDYTEYVHIKDGGHSGVKTLEFYVPLTAMVDYDPDMAYWRQLHELPAFGFTSAHGTTHRFANPHFKGVSSHKTDNSLSGHYVFVFSAVALADNRPTHSLFTR